MSSLIAFSRIRKSPIQGTHFHDDLNNDILEADNLFGLYATSEAHL